MIDPQLESRRRILADAATTIRALRDVRMAQLLEDDDDRMAALLDGLQPSALEQLAHAVELEAARLRPESGLIPPSASEHELGSSELAPAGDMLSDLGVA